MWYLFLFWALFVLYEVQLDSKKTHYSMCNVESQVFEPPREKKIWEIGGNITAFGWVGETTFGLKCQGFQETEGVRNQDSL